VDLLCRAVVIGNTPTLTVSGEIDMASVPQLHSALRRIIADHRGQVVAVDLDQITVLDDVGMGVLLGCAGHAREQGGDVVVVCTSPRLLARFALSGMDRAVHVRARIAP
jgi:anti-sigma B factor antagonist